MRILQVLPDLSAGGAEGFVTNLGVSLAELGAEVRFFLMAGVRGERGHALFSRLSQAGIEVTGAIQHNVRSPKNLFSLVSIIRSWKPDIVHANMYTAEVPVAIAKTLSFGNGTCFVRRLAGTSISGYRSPMIVRLMDRLFDQTIACSPTVAEAYQSFMKNKQMTRVAVISNGGLLRETVTAEQDKLRARDALGISRHSFVVSHIGRMLGGERGTGLDSEPKAQDVLLKAFAKAFKNDPHCLLLLVGDGPLKPEAEMLARDLGIASKTRFLGQQSEPWPVLEAADIFCFPSRHEGLPNVLPEAASCGLPIVASDIPEIRYLYPGDAWLLKPVDNVEAFAEGLLSVRANIKSFSVRAHKVAQGLRKQFSMSVCAERYLTVYKEALRRDSCL